MGSSCKYYTVLHTVFSCRYCTVSIIMYSTRGFLVGTVLNLPYCTVYRFYLQRYTLCILTILHISYPINYIFSGYCAEPILLYSSWVIYSQVPLLYFNYPIVCTLAYSTSQHILLTTVQ